MPSRVKIGYISDLFKQILEGEDRSKDTSITHSSGPVKYASLKRVRPFINRYDEEGIGLVFFSS